MSLPKTWIDRYPHLFRPEDAQLKDTHTLRITHPICLSNIVLQPISAGASREDGSLVVEWLSSTRTIVHLGDTISAPSPLVPEENTSPQHRFKIKMIEPSATGYVDKSSTRVVLIDPGVRPETKVNGFQADFHAPSDEDTDSLYDIDEQFLGNMVDSGVNARAEVGCPRRLHVYFGLIFSCGST